MKLVWIATPKFGGGVVVRDDVVVEAPPYLFRFVGQHLGSLLAWLSAAHGGVRHEELEYPVIDGGRKP